MQRINLSELLAIAAGGLLGALLLAAAWLFFLYEPIFTALFGPGYYFADGLMFIVLPATIVLAAVLGAFAGAALFDYGFRRWTHMAKRRPVDWGAAGAGALGFLLGLLAVGSLALGCASLGHSPGTAELILMTPIPMITLLFAVLAYMGASRARQA